MVFKSLNHDHIIQQSYEGLLTDAIYSTYKNLWVGKLKMLFGYRLRAGYLNNNLCCELDICCGPLKKFYDELHHKVLLIINNNPLHQPFRNIPPSSKIKPYYNDIDFCNCIDDLY